MVVTVNHTTWIDYYIRSLQGRPAVVNSIYNELVDGYLNNDEKHLNSILEHQKLNFILVPSTNKGHLHCIHHCSVYEDDLSGKQIIVGIHGTRFTSPWKVLP